MRSPHRRNSIPLNRVMSCFFWVAFTCSKGVNLDLFAPVIGAFRYVHLEVVVTFSTVNPVFWRSSPTTFGPPLVCLLPGSPYVFSMRMHLAVCVTHRIGDHRGNPGPSPGRRCLSVCYRHSRRQRRRQNRGGSRLCGDMCSMGAFCLEC